MVIFLTQRRIFFLLVYAMVFFLIIQRVFAPTTIIKPTSFTNNIGALAPAFAYDNDPVTSANFSTSTPYLLTLIYEAFNGSSHSDSEKITNVILYITLSAENLVDDVWAIQYSNDSQNSVQELKPLGADNFIRQNFTYHLNNPWTWSQLSTNFSVIFSEAKNHGKDYSLIRIYEIWAEVTYETSNTPPSVTNVAVDDTDTSDNGAYLDPIPNETLTVTCQGVITDDDGDTTLSGANATLYLTSIGSSALDDPRNHYTNTTCVLDTAYGTATEALATCQFSVLFYATPGQWQCNLTAWDNANAFASGQDATLPQLREILALDIDSSNPLNFGVLPRGGDSGTNYQTLTIYNIGNVIFDLNLEVYGSLEDDGLSMVCTSGTIADSYLRFDATDSLTDYSQFTPAVSGIGTDITTFDHAPQTSGNLGSTKNIRLGMGIPSDVAGSCSGTLMVTALPNQ